MDVITEGRGRAGIVQDAGDGVPNATVMLDVDADEFLARLLNRLSRYSDVFGKAKDCKRAGIGGRPALAQNPHEVKEPKENNLEQAIGRAVREFRKALGITVADLATSTGLSVGMLSKIENGAISPSLTTLQAVARALGMPITDLFKRFEEPRNAVFVKAGEGVQVERRGTRAGHHYPCSDISKTIAAAWSSHT